jgi:hypothetical protein
MAVSKRDFLIYVSQREGISHVLALGRGGLLLPRTLQKLKIQKSQKTGVRKRIDPRLAHQIQGALNDPMSNCICRENVYTGAGCPIIGQPCTHWPKSLPHKTEPLRPPNVAEMAPWTRLSVA